MVKKKVAVSVFIAGVIALAAGVAFLVINLKHANRLADAEFLVEKGEWTLSDAEGVVWEFTEVGKGTLTTNGHTNDYDFIWAIEDGKLKIETAWLQDLEDEYEYTLDQDAGTLELKNGDETAKFVAR